MPKDQFVSCLKAKNMISQGCMYHLIRFRDRDSQNPTLELVPLMNEFLQIFLDDFLNVPPKIEIHCDINLLPETQPLYIPPNLIAPTQLKELNEH